MKFVDEVALRVQAGLGGDGCLSFRHARHAPKGGPDGGNGGAGGSAWIQADPRLTTLLDLSYPRAHKAGRGGAGGSNDCQGRRGKDLVIRVPVGTIIHDVGDGLVLADLATPGERVLVARGGRGGRGNASFATSTNRAPRIREPGGEGEEKDLRLELKLLADAGIVGFPNAGKSTLLSRVSAARPRIADYPFTTLTPNLGVVRVGEEASFVLADIPGLIEGAHEGAGLGVQFLRHIERTAILIHLIDTSSLGSRPAIAAYRAINEELASFSESLARKPQIVALNKLDVPEARKALPRLLRAFRKLGVEVLTVSAYTGEGVKELMAQAWLRIAEARRASALDAPAGEALAP